MKKQKGFTLTELILALISMAVFLGLIIGWVWNIVKIYSGSIDPITLKMILRIVGIFIAPLGAILGYL